VWYNIAAGANGFYQISGIELSFSGVLYHTFCREIQEMHKQLAKAKVDITFQCYNTAGQFKRLLPDFRARHSIVIGISLVSSLHAAVYLNFWFESRHL
jgi:hypothetical protein